MGRASLMEIRFVSSLTPEDEAHVAQALATVIGMWLDQLPLLYTMQITTSEGQVTTRRSVAPEGPTNLEFPVRRG